jgi:hypothetical protein
MGLFLHPATLPLAPALPASHDELHQCTSVPATCSGAACNKSESSTALRKVLSSPALYTRCSVALRPAGRACPRQSQQHRCSTLDLSRGGMTANMH